MELRSEKILPDYDVWYNVQDLHRAMGHIELASTWIATVVARYNEAENGARSPVDARQLHEDRIAMMRAIGGAEAALERLMELFSDPKPRLSLLSDDQQAELRLYQGLPF